MTSIAPQGNDFKEKVPGQCFLHEDSYSKYSVTLRVYDKNVMYILLYIYLYIYTQNSFSIELK